MEVVRKVSLISLSVFLFLIPFAFKTANLCLFIFIAGTLLDSELYKKYSFREFGKAGKCFVFFSSAYCLWCFISLLWSDDLDRGLLLAGRYILIIIFPFFLLSAKTIGVLKNIKLLVCFFIGGVLLSSFVCLYLSYLNCWHEVSDVKVFNFDYYNRPISFVETISSGTCCFSYSFLSHFIHPAYYTLYFVFILIVLFDTLFKDNNHKMKVPIIISIVYSFVFIFFLQSRAGLLVLMVTLILCIAYYAFMKKQLKIFFIGFIIIIVLLSLIVPHTRFYGLFEGVKKSLDMGENQEYARNYKETENLRILIWKNSFSVIKHYPILGVGIGDTDLMLEAENKKHNFTEYELGTHNQYLYAQLSMGIVSLLLLLAILFVPLYYGIKNRYFPLIGFSLAVIINLLFENMLTRNAGLMFIPWAMTVLLMMSEEKKKVLEK